MARVFDYHWFSHASMAMVVVLLCMGAGSVEASIILKDSLLDAEPLFVETDATSSSSSSSAHDSDEQPLGGDNRPEDPGPRGDALFSPSQSSSGGMSSGASGVSSGPIATGAFAINCIARVSCTANELSTRVGDDPSFTLPIPPDNELLRPPQASWYGCEIALI